MSEVFYPEAQEILVAAKDNSLFSLEAHQAILEAGWRKSVIIYYPEVCLESNIPNITTDLGDWESDNSFRFRFDLIQTIDAFRDAGLKVAIVEKPSSGIYQFPSAEKIHQIDTFSDLIITPKISSHSPAALVDLLAKQNKSITMEEADKILSNFPVELIFALDQSQRCVTLFCGQDAVPDYFKLLSGQAKRICVHHHPGRPMFAKKIYPKEASIRMSSVTTLRPGSVRRRMADLATEELKTIQADVLAFFGK